MLSIRTPAKFTRVKFIKIIQVFFLKTSKILFKKMQASEALAIHLRQ